LSREPVGERAPAVAAPVGVDAGRRAWLAGAAALATAWPSRMMAQGAAPPERRQRIAEAIGIPLASLKQVQRLALPPGLGEVEWWLAVGERQGDPKPWLLALGPAASSPPAAPLVLPTASRADLLAQLDLQGAPRKLDPSGPAMDPGQPWRARPAAGALLLRAHHRLDGGEQRETLVLVAVGATPVLLWEAVARSERPRSEGHSSFSLEFVADPASAPWLGIALFQTTLPAAGQPAGMPGPPLRQRFSYRAGAYQRTGG
jgi:hypothetical protein